MKSACILLLVLGAAMVASARYIPAKVYECEKPYCSALNDALITGIKKHKAAPGIAASVLTRNGTLFMGAAGSFTYDPNSATATNETLWDMASCTKVLVTNTAVAQLYQKGLLDLDMKVADATLLGPNFASQGKGDITVRNCLLHNAGYPPDPNPNYWSPFFPCEQNTQYHPAQVNTCQATIFNHLLFNQTIVTPPGYQYVYSDLSFITLMFVVGKRVKDLKLVSTLSHKCRDEGSYVCWFNAYAEKEVLFTDKMPTTGYVPTDPLKCAPEWYSPAYHHAQIAGYVSDGNAYALGGISGHAGLFTNVVDASFLARRWAFATDPARLNQTTIDLFRKVANLTQSNRALGWDTNHNPDWKWCGELSNSTYFHIGYTGTQLCIDPERNIVTVLLANGRYPEFLRDGMINLRPSFNSLVAKLFGP